jgi:hypothetical protein
MENERLIISTLLYMVPVEIAAEQKKSQPRGRSLSKSNRSSKLPRNRSRNRSKSPPRRHLTPLGQSRYPSFPRNATRKNKSPPKPIQ